MRRWWNRKSVVEWIKVCVFNFYFGVGVEGFYDFNIEVVFFYNFYVCIVVEYVSGEFLVLVVVWVDDVSYVVYCDVFVESENGICFFFMIWNVYEEFVFVLVGVKGKDLVVYYEDFIDFYFNGKSCSLFG